MKSEESYEPNSFAARYFNDCFPTLERMAKAFDESSSVYVTMKDSADCMAHLNDGFVRVIGPSKYGHLTSGYRYYRNVAGLDRDKSKVVWVVRLEYQARDLEAIDAQLGGNTGSNFTDILNDPKSIVKHHDSEHYTKSGSYIPQKYMIHICCALWPEFVAYRDLVDRSANLDEDEVLETYQLSWKRCGVTSWEELDSRCDKLESVVSREIPIEEDNT